MASPTKEGTDPNVISGSAMRKRRTPGSSSPSKRQQKRRMSMRNRRVSFAPDPELTMVHTFEKDDYGAGDQATLMSVPEPHPASVHTQSPMQVDMEITMPLGVVPEDHTITESMHGWDAGPDDITAAVPSLADLARADEAYVEEGVAPEPLDFGYDDNITAAVPDLATLLEEDEEGDGYAVNALAPTPPGKHTPAKTCTVYDMETTGGMIVDAQHTMVAADDATLAQPASNPAATPSMTTMATGVRQAGQANKWGFVPGDDDTMELDLEENGRVIMGEHTYNRMYGDAVTGHPGAFLAQGRMIEDDTAESLRQPIVVDDPTQDPASRELGVQPDWTAPAFLPPYMAPPVSADHPALHQSPALTNSSLNTMSTRRVSGIDVRRQSITSRRMSLAGDALAAALLEGPPTRAHENEEETNDHDEAASDVTDDLLADGDDDGGDGNDNVDLLAGLQRQVRTLSPESPGGVEIQRNDPIPVQATTPFQPKDRLTTGAGAASVGYAGSSYNATTAALLRTGGTNTEGLLVDGSFIGGAENGGGTTHGTTRLLRLDATASSAIAVGAKALLADGHPQQHGGHAASPGAAGAHKMSHSPPPSALASVDLRRQTSVRASPAVLASLHSARSASVLARTPGSAMLMTGPPAGGPHMAPPGSAIAARYPNSAVATGRLSQGFTPSTLAPITFQDFTKFVEVQFLDNLRRGASINYADLAPNPVPSNIVEAYTLLCVTSPNVKELEVAISTLQSESSRLRSSAADLEVMLGQANPPIFRHVQTASSEQLEAFRANVGMLKKVCRAKALVLLKDVRCQMEESKARRLAAAANFLSGELAYVKEHAAHMDGVAKAVEAFADATRERLGREAKEREAEAERRQRTMAARNALDEIRAANAARRQRLEEAMAKAAELRSERELLTSQLEATRKAFAEAKAALEKATPSSGSQTQTAGDADPRAILAKLQAARRLERCLGVKLERTDGMACTLQVGSVFRLHLITEPTGVRGLVELAFDRNQPGQGRPDSSGWQIQSSLAAALAGCGPNRNEIFCVDASSAAAAVQAEIGRLLRCIDLAMELQGARAAHPHLCEISTGSGTAGVTMQLTFAGLQAGVRFSVTLQPGHAYPLGDLPVVTRVWFDGEGQISPADVEAVVAAAPAGPGRIRAACAELSKLVDRAAPLPAGEHLAFQSNFGNPLFVSVARGGHVTAEA